MLNTIDLHQALALTAGVYVIFVLAICLFLKGAGDDDDHHAA